MMNDFVSQILDFIECNDDIEPSTIDLDDSEDEELLPENSLIDEKSLRPHDSQ